LAVTGEAATRGDILDVRCDVRHRTDGRRYLARRLSENPRLARRAAHRLADEIVAAVTGKPGIAATTIALIGVQNGTRDLYLCDADGEGMRRVTRDRAVCLSPAWTPDAQALVYTSFHRGFPDVYRIDLQSGSRVRLAGFPGLNAAADVSPDGRAIALTLSKDGNPELYVMDLRSRYLSRQTRTRYAAEASPSWSPDGNRIVFVSDRSGSPQLYIMRRDGGPHERLSYRGTENVSPDWGPHGEIAFTSRRDGRYNVYVIDPATRAERAVGGTGADFEDPSWAPDGRHLVCTRTAAHHTEVYILDTLGDPPLRLTALAGEWHFPAWSPK
ncbi:MAG: PD40 domain-containing protein, partial [Lentisphaerae bacterium]|nr:PD40 domain-containing protein [Lentisphaerota bacterium]